MPSSFQLSLLPIDPFVQRRSSFVRLPRACVYHVSEQPSPIPEPLPNALFVQPRSLHELPRTTFEFLFPFHMSYRTQPAQRRFHEVPLPVDLVPSLTTGRLRPNCALSSPLVRHCNSAGVDGDCRLMRLSDHAVANTWWSPSSLPSCLNEECYIQQIQPQLRTIKIREISETMHVSKPYAALVRAGRRQPHPRHWLALAKLVGVTRELVKP